MSKNSKMESNKEEERKKEKGRMMSEKIKIKSQEIMLIKIVLNCILCEYEEKCL